MQEIVGGTTSTGTINAQVYIGDSTAPFDSYASSATNSGTLNYIGLRWGKLTNAPTLNADWDDIVCNVGTSTPIGPAFPGAFFF